MQDVYTAFVNKEFVSINMDPTKTLPDIVLPQHCCVIVKSYPPESNITNVYKLIAYEKENEEKEKYMKEIKEGIYRIHSNYLYSIKMLHVPASEAFRNLRF